MDLKQTEPQLLRSRKIEDLLAAVQEIDRLALQALDGITQDMVEAAVTDQARFDVYQWLDAALAGQTSSLRMLRALEAEGVDAVVIASALTREVRQLAQMSIEANASRLIIDSAVSYLAQASAALPR